MSALDIVKDNPGLAIGGVVVAVLLLTLRGGSSSPSASSMINAQLQSQKTASATDIAISGINAKAASDRTAQIASVYKTQITSGAQLAATKDTNSVKLNLGMSAIGANQQVQNANIAAKRDIAAQTLQTQVQIIQDNNALKHYQLDMTSANLPQILASQQTLAQINGNNLATLASLNGQTAQAVATINSASARTNAQTAQNTASNNSDMGWVSTVAGIASLFFSDVRLKKNIERIYTREDGLGVFRFNYLDDADGVAPVIGVMAQEVENVYPLAVHTMSSGFKAVDYAALSI